MLVTNRCPGHDVLKIERATDMLLERAFKHAGVVAKVLKFAHNEDEEDVELKYDIHFFTKEDAQKAMNALDEEKVEYVVYDDTTLVYCISWDSTNVDEVVVAKEAEVKRIEELLGCEIEGTFDDRKVFEGEYYWGLVEEVLFV